MKILSAPVSTATPQQLFMAHAHLMMAFVLNILVNITGMYVGYMQIPVFLVYLLVGASLCTSLYMIYAHFMAGRRIGFDVILVVLALILGFYVPILALVLVVSAEARLIILLKKHGYGIGLFAPRKL